MKKTILLTLLGILLSIPSFAYFGNQPFGQAKFGQNIFGKGQFGESAIEEISYDPGDKLLLPNGVDYLLLPNGVDILLIY